MYYTTVADIVAFLFADRFALRALVAFAAVVVVAFAFETVSVLERALLASPPGPRSLAPYLALVECNLGVSAGSRRLELRLPLHLTGWPL